MFEKETRHKKPNLKINNDDTKQSVLFDREKERFVRAIYSTYTGDVTIPISSINMEETFPTISKYLSDYSNILSGDKARRSSVAWESDESVLTNSFRFREPTVNCSGMTLKDFKKTSEEMDETYDGIFSMDGGNYVTESMFPKKYPTYPNIKISDPSSTMTR